MNNRAQQQNTKGAAMLIFVMFFLMASVSLTYAISYSIYSDLRTHQLIYDSKQSLLVADSGLEDMAYKYIAGLVPDATEVITLAGVVATTTAVFDNVEDVYNLTSRAVDNSVYRSARVTMYLGSGASFNFGVQAGNGGFELTNGSSVVGNVFANGTVQKTGGGSATIFGDVISAGPSGLINDVTATGSAWAHIIRDSTIGGNAYAYTIDDGTITGSAQYFNAINTPQFNGSPNTSGVIVGDEDPTDLPITDEDIDEIKQDILDNGTIIASTSPQCISGEYYTDVSITLGFVKIECDFEMKKTGGGTTLTLTGPIWVEGNVVFSGGPSIEVDSAVGNKTVPFIAHKPSNEATSGTFLVQNGTTFDGSGEEKSYVLLISQNTDAENGETNNVDAIRLEQSSSGDLLVYAGHGRVSLANSIALNEITGYKIRLGNSAQVTYESGLVNLLFTAGPGGGFSLSSWKETQ